MTKEEKRQIISKMLDEFADAAASADFAKNAYGRDRPAEYHRLQNKVNDLKIKILKSI